MKLDWGGPGDWLVDPREGLVLRRTEMDELSRRAIGLLRAAGLGPGGRMILRPGGGLDELVLLAGALRGGVAVALLHPEAPPAMVEALRAAWPAGDAPDPAGIADAAAAEPARLDPDAEAVLIFSSGSTGPARGVRLSLRGLVTGIDRVRRAVGVWRDLVRPGTREGVAALLHTITGYRLGLVAPAVRGTVPVLLDRRAGVGEMLASVEAAAVEVLHVGPAFVRAWLARPQPMPACLRLVAVGGGPVADEDRAAFVEATRLPLLRTYGLTETAGTVVACADEPGRPLSPGMGPPSVPVRIEGGRLWVRPEHPALGYVDGSPIGPWVDTGDVAELVDGNLHLRGRAHRTWIAPTGEKVQLEDLDALVLRHLGVAAVAVGGVVLVHEGPADPAWERRARRILAAELPPYARPRRWIAMPALPRLPGGKVDLQAIARRVEAEGG